MLISWVEQKIEAEYASVSVASELVDDITERLTADLDDFNEQNTAVQRRLNVRRSRRRDEQAKLLQAHYADAVPSLCSRRNNRGLAANSRQRIPP